MADTSQGPQPGTPSPAVLEPVPPASAAPPPSAATAPPPESAVEAEPGAIDVDGTHMVPLAALVAERRQRQEATEKAAKVGQYEEWFRQAKPYVDFLQANPQLMQPRAPASPAAAPAADPDAIEAAKLMDFYQADGQPDVARGGRWLELQDRRSARVARATVQPMAQQSAQERSQHHYALASQMRDADGRQPSQEALRTIWAAMPAEYTADPQVASLLAVTALGLDQVQRKSPPKAPEREPQVTEPLGASPPPRAGVSDIEQRVIAQRGLTSEKWQERTKGFKSGRPSPLED